MPQPESVAHGADTGIQALARGCHGLTSVDLTWRATTHLTHLTTELLCTASCCCTAVFLIHSEQQPPLWSFCALRLFVLIFKLMC